MPSTLHSTTTAQVREALIERSEIALLDVREEGPFAEAHPLFAASLPLGRLELEIFDRVPRRATPIVVYDNGEGLNTLPSTACEHWGIPTSRYSREASTDGDEPAARCSAT